MIDKQITKAVYTKARQILYNALYHANIYVLVTSSGFVSEKNKEASALAYTVSLTPI